MINHIIIYILIFLAGFFSAVMDTVKDHYNSSIWWNKRQTFWNPAVSWQGKKFLGIMVLDAWHLSKTVMLLLIFLATSLSKYLYWWEYLTLYFFAYGSGFNIGYNWLLKRR